MSCGCHSVQEPPASSTSVQVRLALAVFFGMTTMTLAWVGYVQPFGDIPDAHLQVLAWAMGLLSAPVLVAGGGVFVKEAWAEVSRRSVGMSTLVTLAVSAAWLYSWALLATGEAHVFFDTAAMIIVFLLVGRVVETRLARSSSRALDAWLASLPSQVWRVESGRVERVDAATVGVGEHIDVPTGDMVPLDGVITEGAADVDRSMLTGESLPVTTAVGEHVSAGTVVVAGRVRLRVTDGVGSRGIEALVESVKRIAKQRPRLQRIADRFAARLTYAAGASALALITVGSAWLTPQDALLRGLAVLLVACPCVAGLATPAAVAAGATAAARRGFVLRDPEAFEALAAVDHIVFDKTGTLTESRLSVHSYVCAPSISRANLLAIAAAAEHGVRHPIAEALVDAGKGLPHPELSNVQLSVGQGLRASWQGQSVRIGRRAFVQAEAPCGPTPAVPGASWVHIGVGGRWWGAVAVVAPLRSEVPEALDRLAARGLAVEMATGDDEAVAEHVGGVVGLHRSRVHASLTPADKAQLLERLRDSGSRVAFVGDGINDGPALAAAHVGVAVGSATAVAEAAARVVVTTGGAERIPALLELARVTHRAMRINLAWAFAYNVVTLPLAALGLLEPAWAALMMVGSSTLVLGNSLRLLRLASAEGREERRDGAGGGRLVAASALPRPCT